MPGVILFELLTLCVPYADSGAGELDRRDLDGLMVRVQARVPAGDLTPHLPDSHRGLAGPPLVAGDEEASEKLYARLKAVAVGCWALQPSARPPMAMVADELAGVLEALQAANRRVAAAAKAAAAAAAGGGG